MTIDREAVAGAMIIGREAVDRILDATFKRDVPDIDRDKLAARLNTIAGHHRIRVIQKTALAERRDRIKKAVRAARRLIRENEWILAGTEAFAPEPQPHSAAIQRMIADWIAASDLPKDKVENLVKGALTIEEGEGKKIIPESDALPYKFRDKGFSALEETTHRLQMAFALFSNQLDERGQPFGTATRYRKTSGGRYEGAVIDFAEMAFEEMGIVIEDGKSAGKPFSRSSIATALRRLEEVRKAVAEGRYELRVP